MVTFLILYFFCHHPFWKNGSTSGCKLGFRVKLQRSPKVRFEDNVIAQVSLMVLNTHLELTTEHGQPLSLAVSREEMGPGANDVFVINVSVSPK